MDNTIDSAKIVRDISLLYELSLAVGNSLDLQQNCEIFLKTLMARKNLAFASVWLKNTYLPDRAKSDGASLVYANPRSRVREEHLPDDHALMVRVTEQAAFSVTSSDDDSTEIVTEKDITRGTFAVFALGQIGVLKLHAPTREEPFTRAELGQLANVIDKFTTSLEGCLAHQRVIGEIAERERVQQELGRERNLLQALLDNAPDWIFFKDAQSRIIKSNKTHAQVLGLDDPQEAIGKTDFDFFPPDDAERFFQEEQEFLQAGRPIIGRIGPTPAPDGEILWRSETKVPLSDEAGQIIGLIGISRDVTELKRAQEMLQMRVKELDCLNEVGREIEESPEIPDLLEWVTERIPPAMRYPELCQVAIEYDDQVYGVREAIDLPTQMAHGLYIGGELLGRIYIAYIEKQEFLDEESALLGGIATRLSSYIENQRLITVLEQRAQERERLLAEVEATYRQYVQQEWQQFLGEQHRGQWRIEHATLLTQPGGSGDHKVTIEAPIALRGQQIGSLRLEDLDPDRRWTAEEKALVEAVSEQLALTVENLRLFENTQRDAWRNQMISETTAKVWASSEIEAVMRTAVAELGEKLNASEVVIRLGTEADLVEK